MEEERIFEACDEKKTRGGCSEKKEKAERKREKKLGILGRRRVEEEKETEQQGRWRG